MGKTLFVGNIPYYWEQKDVISWLREIAPDLSKPEDADAPKPQRNDLLKKNFPRAGQ